MTLFEMLIAGACWLYPLCILLTYWSDWLCLRSLLTQPTAKRWIPASRHGLLWEVVSLSLPPLLFLQKNHYTLPLRDVSPYCNFFGWAERTAVFPIVTVSPAFTPWTCHQRPSGEIVVKQKRPLFFPWGRLISKEMEIQGACWSCLVWPRRRNWWEKGASGSCILNICSYAWEQPWCAPAAGGGRLLLLPKRASGSVRITPWQCVQSR